MDPTESSGDEEDIHQCGRCKQVFHSIDVYFDHKKSKSCQKATTEIYYMIGESTCSQDNGLPGKPTNMSFESEGTPRDQESMISDTTIEIANPLQLTLDEKAEVEPDWASTTGSSTDLVVDPGHAPELRAQLDGDLGDDDALIISEHTSMTEEAHVVPRKVDKISLATEKSNEDYPKLGNPRPSKRKAAKSDRSAKMFNCPECDHSVLRKDEFDRHLRVAHNLTTYICLTCVKPFRDKYKLRRHQDAKRCHNEEGSVAPMYMKFQSSSRIYKHDVGEECVHDRPAKNKDWNVVVSTGEQSSIEPMDNEKRTIQGDHEMPGFKCMECDEHLQSYSAIERHARESHSISAGICPFCGKWFTTKYKLWRHIQSSVHDNLPPEELSKVKPLISKLRITWTGPGERKPMKSRRYDCTRCNIAFNNRRAFRKHTSNEHEFLGASTFHTCEHCGITIRSRKKYWIHLRTVHKLKGRVGSLPCLVCEKKFKQSNHLERHWQTLHLTRPQGNPPSGGGTALVAGGKVTLKESRCFVCCDSLPNSQDRQEHVEKHRVWHPDVEKGGPLPADLFTSPERKRPRDVQEKADSEDMADAMPSIIFDTDTMNINEENCLEIEDNACSATKCGENCTVHKEVCPFCDTSFSTLSEVYQHNVDTHKLVLVFKCIVESCQVTFTDAAAYEEHQSIHSQKAFICGTCNGHFSTMASLAAHRTSFHRRERSRNFVCICQRGYATEEQLNEHMRENKGHFPCQECGKVLRRKVDLTTHMLLHKNELPYLCEQCGMGFTKKMALKVHAKSHEGQRSYKCTQCESAFLKKEHLLRHTNSKHSDLKPYICDICEKAFKRPDKLKQHSQIHTNSAKKPHVCSQCGMSYRYRDSLKYHERSHTRERKYQCTLCPVNFPRPGQLKKHLLEMHSVVCRDQHLYPCNMCDSTFSRPERVKRHLEKVHRVTSNWSHICSVCTKGFPGEKSLQTHMRQLHLSNDTSGTSLDVPLADLCLPLPGSNFAEVTTGAHGSRSLGSALLDGSVRLEYQFSTPATTAQPATVESPPKQDHHRDCSQPASTTVPNAQKTVFMHLHPPLQLETRDISIASSSIPVSDVMPNIAPTSFLNYRNVSVIGQNSDVPTSGHTQPSQVLLTLAPEELTAPADTSSDLGAISLDLMTPTQQVISQQSPQFFSMPGPNEPTSSTRHLITSQSIPVVTSALQQTGLNSQSLLQFITLDSLCLPGTSASNLGSQPSAGRPWIPSNDVPLSLLNGSTELPHGVQAITIPYIPQHLPVTDINGSQQLSLFQPPGT